MLAAEYAPAKALIDRAEASYFAGKFDDAWKDLEDAVAQDAKQSEITAERPQIFLLRAAVKLKQNDEAAAKREARIALQIDPGLVLDEYPTDLGRLFEEVLADLPPRVLLRFTGLPEGATARVDSRRLTAGVISVIPGTHQLVVNATDFEPLAMALDVKDDATIPIAMKPLTRTKKTYLLPAALLGVSAASAAGGGFAYYNLSVTRANQAGAGRHQQSYYDAHATRFRQQAIAGFAVSAAAGAIGGKLFWDRGTSVAVVPAAEPGGASVLITARF